MSKMPQNLNIVKVGTTNYGYTGPKKPRAPRFWYLGLGLCSMRSFLYRFPVENFPSSYDKHPRVEKTSRWGRRRAEPSARWLPLFVCFISAVRFSIREQLQELFPTSPHTHPSIQFTSVAPQSFIWRVIVLCHNLCARWSSQERRRTASAGLKRSALPLVITGQYCPGHSCYCYRQGHPYFCPGHSCDPCGRGGWRQWRVLKGVEGRHFYFS